MTLEHVSDEELFAKLIAVDAAMTLEGRDIHYRLQHAANAAYREYGFERVMMFSASTLKSPNAKRSMDGYDRLEEMIEAFYSRHQKASGGHIGVVMYRDIFAKVAVPRMYGQGAIRLLDAVDLTPLQHRAVLMEPEAHNAMNDQVVDVADNDYGYSRINREYATKPDVMRFIELSRFQLHAAAAILTGGYDYRGAIQASVLATELALKAGAVINGRSADELKKSSFGHRLPVLLGEALGAFPLMDADRLHGVIARMPKFVENRYSADQPTRFEAGHIAMNAQFVAAEIMRQLSGENWREKLNQPLTRSYP